MSHQQASITWMCLAAFLAVSLVLDAASSAYAQMPAIPPGSGTSGDPYRISELGHLVWMGDNVANSSGKYYTMTADIDASDTANWNDAGTSADVLEGFKPIGTYYYSPDTTSYRGIFDGNGHIIRDLVVNRPEEWCVGLCG